MLSVKGAGGACARGDSGDWLVLGAPARAGWRARSAWRSGRALGVACTPVVGEGFVWRPMTARAVRLPEAVLRGG